jgi:hypothetical protein
MFRRPNRQESHVVDIFDEVEEELRAERAQQLLQKYAGVLFAVCVLVIGSVGGWKAWGWYQERQDQNAATLYATASVRADIAAAAATNRPAAIASFEGVAANAPAGYRILARLRTAALLADAGDIQGASALWDQVAADGSADPLLRDLASLTWCLYHTDQGDPALVEGRLKPLASPGNAWRSLAQEQLALLDLRQGRTGEAKAQLQKLVEDTTAPSGVRGRASALLDRVSE